MVIKWRRVMIEDRTMKDYLITYSTRGKEHIYALNEAIKYLRRKDCKRIIIENGDLENDN